jgi:hypothetical protein
MVGREAADFLRIGRTMNPEGLIFEPTQVYIRSTLTGSAQPFRVTPLHALDGPLIFGRDLLQAHRLTQGAGSWAIMTVVKILLDKAPDEIDSQGCDDLMVPLADIKRLCRMLDRRDPEVIELLLGKLCLDFPTVKLEEREMETLALVGEHVRAAGEEDYIFCLRALTNLAKRADFRGVQLELWQQLDKAFGDPGTFGPHLMTEARRILRMGLQRPRRRYEYRALTPDDQGETQPEEEEQNEDMEDIL